MKKLITIICCYAALLSVSTNSGAESKSVQLDELNQAVKAAKPGDVLEIKNGTYRNILLDLLGTGTEQAPITIKAQTPGQVIITGKSRMSIAGEWLVIEGLFFKDGESEPGHAVVEFRSGDKRANHCRLTECVIDSYNPSSRGTSYGSVEMFGRYNRVDHNSFTGKLNHGVTLVVSLNEDIDRENYHMVDHNYFGPRPVYGSNGAETIRMGLAQHCKFHCYTTLTENWFDRCNGEVEAVSIKSSDITVSKNLFTQCEGVLALRHGDRNIVDGNMWLGGGVRNTAGVRVVNAGHIIRNNVFKDLKGGRFFAAMALMNAVPNSLPSRYEWVKDVDIYNNTFINCTNLECGTGKDEERTLPPAEISFHNNTIYNSGEPGTIFRPISDMSGIAMKDNSVVKKEPKLPAEPVNRAEMGASWFPKDKSGNEATTSRVIPVKAGQDNLCVALQNAGKGDVLELAEEGEYFVSRSLRVATDITIRAKEGLSSKPMIIFNGKKGETIITICDHGNLVVKDIIFSGKQQPFCAQTRGAISSDAVMITPYTLEVDGCEFFGETGCHPIVGTKNTFCEKLIVRNCKFYDLCYTAIDYSAEKDDMGRYNADDIIIDNCVFSHILNVGVNIYRGGSDESTAGPYVTITNCSFDDVSNMERGSALRLVGPQVMTISDCNFRWSGRGGAAIRLDEATWEKISIHNCNFYDSGRILTMTGKVVDGPLFNEKPEYVNPAGHDWRLVPSSPLATKGSDGKAIGVR